MKQFAILIFVLAALAVATTWWSGDPAGRAAAAPGDATPAQGLPRLLDLGSETCIPCQAMAPILETLRTECAGVVQVDFVDVNGPAGTALARQHGIRLIPTQIFLDAAGNELWRHEGFISREDILARWEELGVKLPFAVEPAFSRLEPAQADGRAREAICHMCDGDIDPRTRATLRTEHGDVHLCSPHCYFILDSCLTAEREGIEQRLSVTDWATGQPVPALEAAYLLGLDEAGRPSVRAFAGREGALQERGRTGGNLVDFPTLRSKELAARCGFCDRAVYPEDASLVLADGLYTWGCCPHCALGVAARAGRDIEVRQRDALTGETIIVQTMHGSIVSMEPASAVAWFGQRQGPNGALASAGCFHQAFFVNEANLRQWVEQHPLETGQAVSIHRALRDKMRMTPLQIARACKLGQCAPR